MPAAKCNNRFEGRWRRAVAAAVTTLCCGAPAGAVEIATFLLGRNIGLFGADAILNDMTLPGVGPGVHHSLTENMALLAEFTDVKAEAHDGRENDSSNFNIGAYLSF